MKSLLLRRIRNGTALIIFFMPVAILINIVHIVWLLFQVLVIWLFSSESLADLFEGEDWFGPVRGIYKELEVK